MTETSFQAEAETNDADRGDASLVALLCLYLVLLAFFVLLNSMTEPDQQRTRSVLESVHEAFDQDIRLQLPPLQEEAPAATRKDAVALLAGELSALLGSLEPVALEPDQRGSDVLRLELEPSFLFGTDDAELRPERLGLLDAVVEALGKPPLSDFHVEVEALHGVETLAQASGGLEVARSGRLVRALADAGLPAERLAAGLVPGTTASLLLEFRLFDRPPESSPLAPRGASEAQEANP